MDTVSMLNTMRFYCQPILPLVYDESMSYYETLCKVVGQLNTTGEAVNKLNEGLTNEIADRQAADAALDGRLAEIEKAFTNMHMIAFDNSGRIIGTAPTREQLYKWVTSGDLICTLLRTSEPELENVFAVTCNYNAGSYLNSLSNDFEIVVPIKTSYNEKNDTAISQKLVKLTIPSGELTEPWGYQEIEIKTPATSADGIVNVNAKYYTDDDIGVNLTPGEFLDMFKTHKAGAQIAVGVNARLFYDTKDYASGNAVVSVGDGTDGKVIIEFNNYYDGVFVEHFVDQLNTQHIFLVGQEKTNKWSIETFDEHLFHFHSYEGFEFTHHEDGTVTTRNESTPAEVAAYYQQPDTLYQNISVRLNDKKRNESYWNGVFDRYPGGMTYTFVTSQYIPLSGTMRVRVMNLSARTANGSDTWVGDEKWAYSEREFELPISSASEFVVKIWPADELNEIYSLGLNAYTADVEMDKTFEEISAAYVAGLKLTAKIYRESQRVNLVDTTNDILVYIAEESNKFGAVRFRFNQINDGFSNHGFANTTPIVALDSTDDGESKYVIFSRYVLPAPYGKKDEGKVPVVQGNMWALKDVNATSVFVVDFWPTGSETYDSVLKAYTIPLASNSTYDDIYKLVKGGAEFIAHIYKEAERINLVGGSDDYEVDGDNTLGTIRFKFIRTADTAGVAGFDSVADYALLIKTDTSTKMLLVIKQLTLPVPNSDGSDNGKVPTIINGKWELKTPPTYANGNEVAY